jgi:hypothetical protein
MEVSERGIWRKLGRFDPASGLFLEGESPEAHGADGRCTQGTNDTVAVQAFFDAIRNGGHGRMEGCYIIDPGALVLGPSSEAAPIAAGGFRMVQAPTILGNGTLRSSGRGHGPLLAIANADQNSGSGFFYAGGELGNLTLRGSGADSGIANAGVSLQGVWNWRIGQLNGDRLGGPALMVSRRTLNGNPDPYGSGGNDIVSVICNHCGAPAADLGALTDSSQHIHFLAAYGDGPNSRAPATGALVSGGQGTQIATGAALLTRGWAVVYGQGPQHGNRQEFKEFELHSPERGLWVGALINSNITGRVNFEKVSNGAVWPLTAVKIGGQGSRVSGVAINLIFRFDAPVTLADITDHEPLIDLSNDPNIDDVSLRITLVDNSQTGLLDRQGRLAVPLQAIVRNVSPSAHVTITINGVPLTQRIGS